MLTCDYLRKVEKNRLTLLMFFVEVPSDLGTTNRKVVKIEEGYVEEIDREAVAPYALINHSSRCCLASRNTGNRDCLATV
jgi:hypothetical protein